MKLVILFEDDPDADPGIREAHMARHLDFLDENSDKIQAAGQLSDPARLGRDGMWIVEADAVEDADQLVHEDPFWPTGLRKSYAIIKWTQVYADGSRLITLN